MHYLILRVSVVFFNQERLLACLDRLQYPCLSRQRVVLLDARERPAYLGKLFNESEQRKAGDAC